MPELRDDATAVASDPTRAGAIRTGPGRGTPAMPLSLPELVPGDGAWRGGRCVVAVVLMCRGRIGLFKRSGDVAHDRGKWHCISGYVDPGTSPLEQAVVEVFEETGLLARDLVALDEGPTLLLPDDEADGWWTVHTYRAECHQRSLVLNHEHQSYRWARPTALRRFDGQVSWLERVVGAVAVPGLAAG